MAYSTTTPPQLLVSTITGSFKIWVYFSADAIADVNTTGYISNGVDLGMQVNDVVWVYDTNTPTLHICSVRSVNTTTKAVNLSDGTQITLANSD
jgi:hypothetical protein